MNNCTRLLRKSPSNMVCVKALSCNSNKLSAEFLLTEKRKEQTLKRMREMHLVQRPLSEENSKRAAVLIPLCSVNNELSLLYTLRNHDLKRHKGQVSFPGGMEDPCDESLRATALRETEEEIGVQPDKINVWGEGNLYVGKEFSILPVVGYLGQVDVNCMKINPDEVAEVFNVPLTHFLDPNNRKHTQFRFKGTSYALPAYINAKHRIWGLTALMTHLFLTSFIPEYYNYTIHYIKPVKAAL